MKKYIPAPVKTFLKMADGVVLSSVNSLIRKDHHCSAETKRCFSDPQSPNYKYEYFGRDTPTCCATNLYTILRDVTKVLEENDLEYFISFGTLLGAVRHGGMIPWDTDVDILVPERERETIITVLKKAFENTTYQVHEDVDPKIVGNIVRVDLSTTNTLHIDLFTYIDEGETIVFGYDRVFSKEGIYPLVRIPFYDLELMAPREYRQHLEQIYGSDYMEYAYRQWALNKKKFKLTDRKPATIEVK